VDDSGRSSPTTPKQAPPRPRPDRFTPYNEPVADVTHIFNDATREGSDMGKYSAL
jgi:hypothetical protein